MVLVIVIVPEDNYLNLSEVAAYINNLLQKQAFFIFNP